MPRLMPETAVQDCSTAMPLKAVFRQAWRCEWLCLAVIAVLALVCRAAPLNRGLGQDELYTAVHYVEAGSIRNTIFSNDAFNNHIGYSVLARLSEALFGRSEWALRLPALILGMASLYVFWLFARTLLDEATAKLATLLLAVSPPHVIWSIEARGYSGMIFFTLLSTHVYFKLLKRPSKPEAALFVAASVCGIYFHLYAVWVTVVQMAFALVLVHVRHGSQRTDLELGGRSRRILYVSFTAIAALSFLCYLPVFRLMLRDVTLRGRGQFNLWFPWAVLQELTGSHSRLIVALVAAISLVGWFSLRERCRLESRYFAGLTVGPLFVMWLARPFDLYPRFFAYWLPDYLLLLAAGIAALWHTRAPWPAAFLNVAPLAAAVLVIALLYHWTANYPSTIPDEGYREASLFAMADARDSAAYCALGGARSVWQYYIPKPIVTPLSLREFENFAKNRTQVRCIYYEAPWQDDEQRKIVQFLLQRASWRKVRGFTVFRYKG